MYERTYWLDHVMNPSNAFRVTDNADGTKTIKRAGTVMQQGTPQDQAHFNNLEEGITDGQIMASLMFNAMRQHIWDSEAENEIREANDEGLMLMETGTKNLSNTLAFPFNNSKQTVALTNARASTNYIVTILSATAESGNIGEILVSDLQTNGFKLEFTGSASGVTVRYMVTGGYYN